MTTFISFLDLLFYKSKSINVSKHMLLIQKVNDSEKGENKKLRE